MYHANKEKGSTLYLTIQGITHPDEGLNPFPHNDTF